MNLWDSRGAIGNASVHQTFKYSCSPVTKTSYNMKGHVILQYEGSDHSIFLKKILNKHHRGRRKCPNKHPRLF